MNRKQRRQAEKKGVTAQDLKKLQDLTTQEAINHTTSAILASVALVVHDKLGFGQVRTMRLLKDIEDQFDSVLKGYITVDDLKKTVSDELGIEMQ